MLDEESVTALVDRFCRLRVTDWRWRIRVVPNLHAAFDVVSLKGPEPRWRTMVARSAAGDFPDSADSYRFAAAERAAYDHALRDYDRANFSSLTKSKRWWLSHVVVSGSHWARMSQTMREARDRGLGWIVPASRDLLIVPRPRLRYLKDRPAVLHDDLGRKAVEWADGFGYHFLHGVPFGSTLYGDVIAGRLSLDRVAALGNADQRSIALTYMSFEHLVTNTNARIVDIGAKGTTLYRLFLPAGLARDRVRGYGDYDYFIHMRDASHPEREFIEWVDPNVGSLGNAELCQAHAFGITLDQWLSVEQEG